MSEEEAMPEEESSENQTEQVQTEAINPPEKKRFFFEGPLFVFFIIFGVVLVSGIVLFQTWLMPIKVVGTSMQPTLNLFVTSETDEDHCDFVLFEKQDSYLGNDIVIVENKSQKYVNREDVNFIIKRVIACPGQTIKFEVTETVESGRNNTIYYYTVTVLDKNGNDIHLDQSYVDEKMYFTSIQQIVSGEENQGYYFPFFNNLLTSLANNGVYEYNVPNGKYFVMGDNRNGSEDSRYFGPVDYENITGVVKKIFPFGTFFNKIFYWRYNMNKEN